MMNVDVWCLLMMVVDELQVMRTGSGLWKVKLLVRLK